VAEPVSSVSVSLVINKASERNVSYLGANRLLCNRYAPIHSQRQTA
jgi:hypothetical protein